MCDFIKRKQLQQKSRMHGWILYSSTEAGISSHYIDLYKKACERQQMSAELVLIDTACIQNPAARQQIKEQIQKDAPAYVINRTRDYRAAELFEEMKIPVFNSSKTARLGNDKALACQYMAQRGIPVMPSVYSFYGLRGELPWYPAVIKSCSGHGGTQVYWIQDKPAWVQWLKEHICAAASASAKTGYIIQQASNEPGRDVRVYIAGNEITAAVLRSSDTDFRSNYCLGGTASLYTLSKKERELARRAASGLEIGMAGIDFIFHNGEMVFNEIEDTAGARALYALSDYDIVDDYIRYIWKELHHAAGTK